LIRNINDQYEEIVIFIYSNRVLNIVSLFLKLKLFSYENCLENYHVDIQTTVHLRNDLFKLSKIMIKTDLFTEMNVSKYLNEKFTRYCKYCIQP
jgi:hypothetical protein